MAVTLKDIAREVGVSITTVSRALAGYGDVAETTRLAVQNAAQELGYVPNVTARRLQKQRTDTLGFIIPTFGPRFSDPFFSEFIAGIGNEAADHNFDLLVSTHPPDSERELEAYRRATSGGWVDGLIVVRTRENDRRIQMLCRHGFPFVAFGRTTDSCDFSYVDEDGQCGMRLLVEHLIELGHRRIAFISPPQGLMFGRYRSQGYYETMLEHDLALQPEWVVPGDMTQRGGADAVEKLLALDPLPTVVIGGNDLMAIGAMNRIQKHGLQVGRDISVAGFDDIPLAAHSHPPLTTIRQPIYQIARETCAMLIDLITGQPSTPPPVQRLMTPELVIRESTGLAREQERREMD